MTSQLYVVEDKEVPEKKDHTTQSHWQLSDLPQQGVKHGSGKKQREVNGNVSGN